MCGLCSIFGEENHWASRPGNTGQSADSVLRRLVRTRRIGLLNRMLAERHIRVSDWQGSHYQLASATGKTALATDLNGIWQAVTGLQGQPFDPLAGPTS